MFSHSYIRALAVLPLLAGPAFAQDEAVTIMTAESEEHGTYLTDGEGRSVYLFEADTQGEGDTMPVMTCEGECLEHWPPVMTQSEPQAGEGAMAEMLGTLSHDGTMHVTYNGWPLYYYHEDTEPGQTNGHDIEEFGAEWYLLTPEGEKAGEEEEHEEEASGGGEAKPAGEAEEATGGDETEASGDGATETSEGGGSDY